MSEANDLELDAEERKLFEERAQRLRADDVPSWEELEARMAKPAPQSFTGVGTAAIVAAAAALALAWSLSRARPPAPTQAPAPAPAAVAPAAPAAPAEASASTPGDAHVAAGYVAAKTPITLSAMSGGTVKDVKVRTGDKITKGQLLVQLDDSDARADYVAATAELRAADAQLGTRRKLTFDGAATPVDVERANHEVSVARAKLSPIMARISQAKITSPIDGVVLERLAEPGETVAATSPLMKIADLTQLAVEVDIVEGDVSKIHVGQAVKVTSDAAPDRSFDGKVYEIAAEVDKARGTVLVKVELRASYPTLRPGSSARCAFLPTAPRRVRVEPAPRVDEEPGYLVANTQPWSRVFVDGKDTGQSTPIPPSRRLRLAPGRRQISFVFSHQRFDYVIDVKPGQEIRLIKQLDAN